MSEPSARDRSDPGFAANWSMLASDMNPVREEQLRLLMAPLHAHNPRAVLDLGVGSGLVAELVLDALPTLQFTGLDSSQAVLTLAQERPTRFENRVGLIQAASESVSVPDCIDDAVDAAIAVQAAVRVHNPWDGDRRLEAGQPPAQRPHADRRAA